MLGIHHGMQQLKTKKTCMAIPTRGLRWITAGMAGEEKPNGSAENGVLHAPTPLLGWNMVWYS